MLTDVDKEDIISAYTEGHLGILTLARQYNVDRQSIRHVLKYAGVYSPHRSAPQEPVRAIRRPPRFRPPKRKPAPQKPAHEPPEPPVVTPPVVTIAAPVEKWVPNPDSIWASDRIPPNKRLCNRCLRRPAREIEPGKFQCCAECAAAA